MNLPHILKFILSLAIFVATPVLAEIYKFRDANGKIHYSDQPFAYKQGSMSEEKKQKSLVPETLKQQRKLLLGHWRMVGSSDGPRSQINAEDSDIWTFNRDGTYLSLNQGHARGDAHYFLNDLYLETSETGARDSYHVLELDDQRLVLQRDSGSLVLHFSRTKTPASKQPEAIFYRRDQVAKVVAMIACGKIDPEVSDPDALRDQQREIFLKTGIVNFEKAKFLKSTKFYRRDATFKEIYEPKIDSDVRRCLR